MSELVKLLSDDNPDAESPGATSDDLHGTAIQDYIDEEGTLVVAKGETLRITQQSQDGRFFIVESVVNGKTSRVPHDLVHIVDSDLNGSQVSSENKPHTHSNLKRRPALDKSRQRPVSLKSRAELVRSMPSEGDYHLLGSDDDDGQPPHLSRHDAFAKGSIKRPLSKGKSELVESTPYNGSVYIDVHPLLDEYDLPSEPRPRSICFPTPASSSSAVCSGISAQKCAIVCETNVEAESPVEPGLLSSQGDLCFRPEFKEIEKLNFISVSGVDREGRPVIVASAVRLPPSGEIDHQTLLEYAIFALDKYAESDYTLVYFHYGLTSKNKPSFSIFRQVYSHLDRKYKKNLKKLYVVHPTKFIKTLYHFLKPLISYKFGKKLTYINRLEELSPVMFLNQIDIPNEVRMYDLTLSPPTGGPKSVFYDAAGTSADVVASSSSGTRQFGVSLEVLQERNHGIPIPVVMETCISYLKNHGGLDKVGIFRRSPSAVLVQEIKARFNEGQEVDLVGYNDPHVAATLLKLFLRELPEPLLTTNTCEQIRKLKGLPLEEKLRRCQEIVGALPPLNREVLHYLFMFVKDVVSRSELNKMTEMNMAIVLGPNLIWSTEVATLADIEHTNSFTYFLIKHTDAIFRPI